MTMLHRLLHGAPIRIRKPSKKDYKYMSKLIFDECGDDFDVLFHASMKNIKRKTPTFISTLFHHFCINVTKAEMNLKAWTSGQLNSQQFGCKVFSKLFMIPDTDIFNTTLIVSLFQNMEEFILFQNGNVNRKWQYISSVDLNNIFCANIISTLKMLNASSSSLKIKHFIFVKPASSISTFIQNNQQKFNSLGWSLSQKTYKHNFWGNCDDCLYIEPSKN